MGSTLLMCHQTLGNPELTMMKVDGTRYDDVFVLGGTGSQLCWGEIYSIPSGNQTMEKSSFINDFLLKLHLTIALEKIHDFLLPRLIAGW